METLSAESDEAAPMPLLKPLIISLVAAAALSGVSLWAIKQLPPQARVPIHWNIHGNIDGYAGRSALFLFPGIMTGLSLLLFFFPRVEARREHLRRSASAYRWVWLMLMSFLAEIQILIITAALGVHVTFDRWAVGGVGIMLLVSGNFFGKIRSNFMFGVRTPWTLSSELSWNRTHRLTGWLFVLGGCVLLTSAVSGVHGAPLILLLFLWVGVTLALAIGYSYTVWLSDSDRKRRWPD